MLVISRRIGESFLIGEDIEATVVDITGEKVVLGISAPRSVPVNRTELDASNSQERSSASGRINAHGFSKQYKARYPGKQNADQDEKL